MHSPIELQATYDYPPLAVNCAPILYYLGADMWGAEKVICYLPVYSEPVSCRPVELPSICLS